MSSYYNRMLEQNQLYNPVLDIISFLEGRCYSLMGGVFAILSALGFTVDNILIRKGLMEENPGSVWDVRLVISLVASIIFIVGVCVATLLGFNILQDFKKLSYFATLLLILAGLLGPVIGALLFTTSIAQIGASHASALWAGSNPLLTTLFAVLILAELPDLIGFFSVLIIVVGITVVGYRGHEGTVMLGKKTKLAGGILALLAGISVALSQVAHGAALKLGATPITAFFVFQATAITIIAIVCYIKTKNLNLKHVNRKSLYYYSGAGVGFIVGIYSLLISFTFIPVWQAVAIRNIQPILVIFLSWIFLKEVDKISLRLVLGATFVTLGVVILNIH